MLQTRVVSESTIGIAPLLASYCYLFRFALSFFGSPLGGLCALPFYLPSIHLLITSEWYPLCSVRLNEFARLEDYDWRVQESLINASLPQYRTTISASAPHSPLRIHFVHKRSPHPYATPLLFCHGWPGSVLEVSKIIEPLTNPSKGEDLQAFHVVAPSIPGFGFSDASPLEGMGLSATAGAFDALMQRLGYEHYVAHGGGL